MGLPHDIPDLEQNNFLKNVGHGQAILLELPCRFNFISGLYWLILVLKKIARNLRKLIQILQQDIGS